jgi:glycosyltransferase involved in cell wall biosynthesis
MSPSDNPPLTPTSDPAEKRNGVLPVPAPLLSVVIPVYNERGTLAEVLRRVRAVPVDKEIILVDDGSTDGTRELLAAMQIEPDLRIIFLPANAGKGAAVRAGFALAAAEIILVQDADLEYDPDNYLNLLRPIQENRADAVYGSRYLEPGAARRYFDMHRLGNRFLTALSNRFTGLALTDMETCYKVFRREVLQALTPRLRENRFGIEPEITARLAGGGYRVLEVPITYRARSYREGKKIGWRDGLRAIWCIFAYRRKP